MNALTPGEQAVWAARFNQAQVDIMGEMQVRHDRASKGAAPTQEQAMEWLGEATRIAIEQAHSAVVTMRRIRAPEGEAGEMLADILGPVLAPMPAPLEGLVGPWDFLREPPPGMMFREGHPDTVVRINAEGWEHAVRLRDAWEKHVRDHDPPGYKTARIDLTEYDNGFVHEVRLISADQIMYQVDEEEADSGEELPGPKPGLPREEAAAKARTLAWSLHDKPHQVSFWVRMGERMDLLLAHVLTWTEEQVDEAWGYLHARALWMSKEPAAPEFWPTTQSG